MKIGLVCPYDLFKGGGVQECVLAMQAELSKRGHKVLIIAPKLKNRPDVLPEFVRLLGAGTDIKSPFHTTAQLSVSVDMNEVDELLAREQFDVLSLKFFTSVVGFAIGKPENRRIETNVLEKYCRKFALKKFRPQQISLQSAFTEAKIVVMSKANRAYQ